MAANRLTELFRQQSRLTFNVYYSGPRAKLQDHLLSFSNKEFLENESHASSYNVLLFFSTLSSACLKLPRLGVTVEVMVMLSQTTSPGQLG